MKLSSAFILEKTERAFEITDFGNISRSDGFLRPFLYDEESGLYSGHICLGDTSRILGLLSQITGEIFLILTGEPDLIPDTLSVPYLILHKNASKSRLLNYIQEIFDTYEVWEERLNNILLKSGNIRELLDTSHKVFCRPLSVMGLDFSPVADTGMEEIPDKSRLHTEDGINMDFVNALTQDETYQKMLYAKEPVLFPGYITGLRSLNINLCQDSHTTHRLVLIENEHLITDGDYCLLTILAGYVEYALYHEQIPSSRQADALHEIFHTVLTDRTADYLKISQRLSALGWSTQHEYLCLILQITYVDQKNLTTRAICNYMEKHFPDSCSFFFREEIVTFFNLTRLSLDSDAVAKKLTYFIRDSFLKAGYSRPMKGHMNLRRQYIQSSTALDVGSRKKPYVWIHHFNQVALTYLLEQSTRRLPGYMLCHEKLLDLKKTDQAQNTEYMQTLRTYLELNLNATQAASALYIHRSTFLYRLDKIKSILDSSLDDPDEIFYLNLSFRLLDQEEEKN